MCLHIFKKEDKLTVTCLFSQIFQEFGEVNFDMYLAGCQGERHTRHRLCMTCQLDV